MFGVIGLNNQEIGEVRRKQDRDELSRHEREIETHVRSLIYHQLSIL